jgi:hypothetical protein
MSSYYVAPQKVECFITIKRNRIKKYEDLVYLKNGREFELELFNPHKETVMVKISFNGAPISTSGICLRPGERVYLERYLDTDKKFKFETYEIDGSDAAKQAIELNGLVEIKTFPKRQEFTNPWGTTLTWNTPNYHSGEYYYRNMPSSISNKTEDYRSFFTCSFTDSNSTKSIMETGMVSEGEKSNQSFSYTTEKFTAFPSEVYKFRIVPESQKPVFSSEIRKYCTSCGTRVKSPSWQFCPSCGKNVE